MDLAMHDLPPAWQEIVQCTLQVAPKYDVPANVVLAVASLERGEPNQARLNSNGSIDYGRMQINSVHLAELNRYGITDNHLLSEGCYPIELAAWMLARHLNQCQDDFWQCAANYHSKTPQHNTRYKIRLMNDARQWANWLKQHFPTEEHNGQK